VLCRHGDARISTSVRPHSFGTQSGSLSRVRSTDKKTELFMSDDEQSHKSQRSDKNSTVFKTYHVMALTKNYQPEIKCCNCS